MKCSIVKELLPSYQDGLTSEKTSADIREHLAECSECRAYEKEISQKTPQEPSEENALELLKNYRREYAVIASSPHFPSALC